jgi:hypothetical protein
MIDETGSGAASGAASGALMGTMIAPGVGTVIGAGVGLLAGGLSGQGAKAQRKAQERALAEKRAAEQRELERQAQGVAATRETFGDVWSWADPGAGPGDPTTSGGGKSRLDGAVLGAGIGGALTGGGGASLGASLGGAFGKKNKSSTFTPYDTRRQDASFYQNLNKTLSTRSQLAGGIEDSASATRDAGTAQLTSGAQGATASLKGSLADNGLLGSSIGDSAKQALLAQFAGGRGNVAAAVEDTRQSGWDSLKTSQLGFERSVRGGSDISGQLQGLQRANLIGGAKASMPYTMFGNLINTGAGLLSQGAVAEAQGGQGVAALGLPKLGVGPGKANTPTGGSMSGGR